MFLSCVLSKDTGEFITPPEVKSAGLTGTKHQEAVASEVINVTRAYLSTLSREELQDKEYVEDELAAVIRRLFRNELGRKPLVMCNLTLI